MVEIIDGLEDATGQLMRLKDHLYKNNPKHILALDGGGIRGIITLAYLEEIEARLAEQYGTGSDFRLCDHYALIGGTSTGSIIATALALGYSAKDILDLYVQMSADAFSQTHFLGGLVAPKFPSAPLMRLLEKHIGDTTLGSDKLRCGLGIVAKRLDSSSVWVFHNHPRGPFYGDDSAQSADSAETPEYTPNKDLPLVNLVRASCAAPTYFDPEFIEVAPGVNGAFIDGGVTPHNNPSLALFMLATLKGYGFRWPVGESRMHILSVGTGRTHKHLDLEINKNTPAAKTAYAAVNSMMTDCENLIQTMMQWMGSSSNAWEIDSEVGNLEADQLAESPLFQYERLNIELEKQWLKNDLGIDVDDKAMKNMSKLIEPEAVNDLLAVGRSAAKKQLDSIPLLI